MDKTFEKVIHNWRRIPYGEHDNLRFRALVQLLKEKGVLTEDEWLMKLLSTQEWYFESHEQEY